MVFKKKKIRRKNQILAKLREELSYKAKEGIGSENKNEKQIIETEIISEPLHKEESLSVNREAVSRPIHNICRDISHIEDIHNIHDELIIQEHPPRIADALFKQLEDEIIVMINQRLEEYVSKRIKGILLPLVKFSLKMERMHCKLNTEPGKYLADLEDDLAYILENSKLKRVSPQVGEKFCPSLHEEVDFSWNSTHAELEILAVVRDGFIWEYNQEMILKPQVVVNRRI